MSPSILPIRPAVHADSSGLLDLYRHLNPGDPRPDVAAAERAFDRFMTHDGSAIFVGDMNGELVASCMSAVVSNLIRDASPYGLIENVVMHRDFRKRGFGKQVLAAAATAAWDAGCWKLMLMAGSPRDAEFLSGRGVRAVEDRFSGCVTTHPRIPCAPKGRSASGWPRWPSRGVPPAARFSAASPAACRITSGAVAQIPLDWPADPANGRISRQ